MARSTILLVSIIACGACSGGAGEGGGAPAGSGGAAGGSSPGTGGGSMTAGSGGGQGGGTGGSGQVTGGNGPGAGAGGGGAGGSGPTSDAAPPQAGSLTIIVAAGDHDRSGTIVSFSAGPRYAGQNGVLVSGNESLPVQIDQNGRAVFVLPSLKAQTQATFSMGVSTPGLPAVTAVREADGVAISIGQRKLLRYQMMGKLPGGVGAQFLRGGYLHPIYTPAGVLVSDDYPGDHRHHHGLWSAWASTTFEGRHIDFWNMGQRNAKVDFEGLDDTWDGPVHAGFRSRQVHVDLAGGGKTALKEQWVVSAYRIPAAVEGGAPPYFVFDLDSIQEAGTASPVMLDKYIYGGFALRGHASWGGGGGATFLTSEGRNRGNGDGTTARWCHIGGQVNGAPVGYAALGHPSNFRAPQPLRINPTDPFFSIAPVQDSGFTIEPGKPYLTRFRIVVSDGVADKALLDRLWNDYATPPVVTVSGQ